MYPKSVIHNQIKTSLDKQKIYALRKAFQENQQFGP